MVIDAAIGNIGAGAAGLGQMPGQGTPASARPEDVQRFEAALGAPAVEPGTVNEAQTAALSRPPVEAADAVRDAARLLPMAPPEAAAAAAPPSLGQSILDGIHSVRGQFDAASAHIEGLLQSQSVDLTVRDMMAVQMQISTFTVQQDLMGKIVGKTTQNIDQMLKAQ
jgi:type III secretion system YscI/HrpB-like protein